VSSCAPRQSLHLLPGLHREPRPRVHTPGLSAPSLLPLINPCMSFSTSIVSRSCRHISRRCEVGHIVQDGMDKGSMSVLHRTRGSRLVAAPTDGVVHLVNFDSHCRPNVHAHPQSVALMLKPFLLHELVLFAAPHLLRVEGGEQEDAQTCANGRRWGSMSACRSSAWRIAGVDGLRMAGGRSGGRGR
jgi:hypothetical protein